MPLEDDSRAPAMKKLLPQASQILGTEGLNELLQTAKRFDGPVTVIHEDDTETRESHYFIRLLLKQVPGYVDASAKVGLQVNQALDLLVHTMNATPYTHSENDINALLLSRYFEQEAKNDTKLKATDVNRLKKMLTLAGTEGVIPHSIFGYTTARRIGISMKDSADLIMHPSDADGALAGYTFGPFNEALSTLAIAEIDPELAFKTFKALGGKRPYYRQGAYRMFTEAITWVCTKEGITPEELMKAYFISETKQDITDFIESFFSDENKVGSKDKQIEIVSPEDNKSRYFIEKDGELEHAVLPYRVKRPLAQGLEDLENLAIASPHEWEKAAEGYWIFNPQDQEWFSLGGDTDAGAMGRVRHEFLAYDIAQLTTEPYLFHVHPAYLEVMLGANDELAGRRFRHHVTKFLSSTPSRADYEVIGKLIKDSSKPLTTRSFIAHSLGITEFTYPDDPGQLERMSRESRDIRDRVLLNFPWSNLYWRKDLQDKFTLVRVLVEDLNRKLPAGFSVNVHPRGSSIEEILGQS